MPQGSWPAHVGLSLLWGLIFLLVHDVVAGFGWAPAAALGSLAVAIATAAAARLSGRQLRMPERAGQLVLLGVAVTVQNLGVCLALDRLGLALTAIGLGAMPLFATLIGQVWGMDRITGTAAIGLAVGFVGLLLVVVFPVEGDSWAFISGILACLLAALAAAFATRYASVRLVGRPEALIGAHLIAAVAALPFALLLGTMGSRPAWGYVALVLLAVVLALAGPVLDVRLPAAGHAKRASRLKAAGVVVAALAGVALYGDPLSPGQVFGGLLLLGGAVLVLDLVPRRASVRWPH
jgi:drug/metabolite transporter (DMT)-like permease